jgi:hypothetical protein
VGVKPGWDVGLEMNQESANRSREKRKRGSSERAHLRLALIGVCLVASLVYISKQYVPPKRQ